MKKEELKRRSRQNQDTGSFLYPIAALRCPCRICDRVDGYDLPDLLDLRPLVDLCFFRFSACSSAVWFGFHTETYYNKKKLFLGEETEGLGSVGIPAFLFSCDLFASQLVIYETRARFGAKPWIVWADGR